MTDRVHLVYDGDCGFCTRTLHLFQRLDVWDRLQLHDARDRRNVVAKFPLLRDADLDDAMFAVRDDRAFRGFFAFRVLVRQSPWTWPLVPLFFFPGAATIGPLIYGWVARNRGRLTTGQCSIPLAPRDANTLREP